MKNKVLATIILLWIISPSQSQNFGVCGYNDTESMYTESLTWSNSSSTWQEYRTPAHWIPNQNTPIKTILVNWIVCRDDNGQNGWQDTLAFWNQVELMFDNINQWYSNSLPKGYSLTCEPSYNHVYDTRIRFELNDILFLNNTSFNESCVASDILNYVFDNYPESQNVLNHIFTMPPASCANDNRWGYYSIYNGNAFVHTYYSMYSDWYVVWNDHIEHIAHEYGHAVGLHHTYDGEKRCISHYDFLDDVFGLCSEETCEPCSTPSGCEDDYVCYLTKQCFWNEQTPPFPLMSGNNINSRYISPKSAGRMHRALSLYDNSFTVNNKPMHKYVKEKYSYSIPLTITSNETWDFAIKMYQDIVVANNAILTITGEVKMPIDGKIIVQPGAQLIIDGGRITSAHNQLWSGIEVWGNKNTHQYAVNGSYGQGYVELKNGATIENAVCALNLWRPDYWSCTGGIVHATDAVFHNNHEAVHALYYKNFHPTNLKETDYNATFRRCQFIVDENYFGDENQVFHKHVDLSHVRGFKFYACDFSVTAPSSNISYWTSGIAGNEAGFLVNGICDSYQIPCSNYDQSTFTGFFTAINAVSDGSKSAPAITVRHSSFDKNDFGIYMRKLSNASVLFNDFEVKRQDNWLCGAGIFSENMYIFSIEENEFKKDNTFNGNGIGIHIKDAKNKNTIYNNLFKNLYCGNLAEGMNFLQIGHEYLGLEYLCNTNIGNDIDFYVLKEPGVYSGIQTSQGSDSIATRNTFSENGYHFFNGGDSRINYYYYNVPGAENETPLYYNADKFFPIPTTRTIGCPSHYSSTAIDTVVLSPSEKQQLEQEYYEAYNTYHSLKTVYEQHVDGGSTQNELSDIASATPSDMWALRAQLLGHSPFLSDTVLRASIDRSNVLTEPVLFEILLSNPDELKKTSLMTYLESKEPPLPNYMLDILNQVANGTTAKTVMQARMAACKGDFSRAAGDIIRSLVNDSVLDINEYRGWLANLEDINADRDIIATYVDEGDFTSALSLADMLPSLYGLTGTDLAEHQMYKDLLMLYRDWHINERNAMQMDSTEKAMVEHIADYGTGFPQIMAQALLAESNWESYAENPFACVTLTLPEGGQGRGYTFTQEDLSKAMGLNISVKPNPATTWATVDYTLPVKMSKATITVTNALGITVISTVLNGTQGQKVLDLRDLAEGIYVYTISCGEYMQTGKLVITK